MAEDKKNERDEKDNKGKALSGLSAALIVYSLAGGSIDGSGNIFGTAVSVKNTTIIYISIIVLLCYLALRYKMVLPNPFKAFDRATMVNVPSDKMFKNYRKVLIKEKMRGVAVKSDHYRTIKKKNGKYRIAQTSTFNTEPDYKLEKWRFWLYGFRTFFYKEDFLAIVWPWVLFSVAMMLVVLRCFGINLGTY